MDRSKSQPLGRVRLKTQEVLAPDLTSILQNLADLATEARSQNHHEEAAMYDERAARLKDGYMSSAHLPKPPGT